MLADVVVIVRAPVSEGIENLVGKAERSGSPATSAGGMSPSSSAQPTWLALDHDLSSGAKIRGVVGKTILGEIACKNAKSKLCLATVELGAEAC